jgi:tetratricopeptide (TPR) repeat protein
MRAILIAMTALLLTGCASSGHRSSTIAGTDAAPDDHGARQTVSLLGRDLCAKPAGADPQGEARLAAARAALRANPSDPERIVAVGRELGYLWRINEAIEVYSDGIRKHGNYAPLYRHRGHRYITLRQFDKAILDLDRAAKLVQGGPDRVEYNGRSSAAGSPTTLALEVWYHLGVARYLNGDYSGALQALEKSVQYSRSDDHFVATTYWRYLAMRASGRDDEEAASLLLPVRSDLRIVENDAYFKLLRMFKGHTRPREILHRIDASATDIATMGHGVACAHEYNHHAKRAEEVRQCVVDTAPWPNFGFIAAEVELARSGQRFARGGK